MRTIDATKGSRCNVKKKVVKVKEERGSERMKEAEDGLGEGG